MKFSKYFKDSWEFIVESKKYIYFMIGIFVLSGIFGFIFHDKLTFIDELLKGLVDKTQGLGTFGLISFIFFNNLQSAFFGMILGIVFGIMPLINAVSNGVVLGYVLEKVFKFSFLFGIVITIIWFISIPFLSKFFSSATLPLILSAPAWLFTLIIVVNEGFLTGAHKFIVMAIKFVNKCSDKSINCDVI